MADTEVTYDMNTGQVVLVAPDGSDHNLTGLILQGQNLLTVGQDGRPVLMVGLMVDRLVITDPLGEEIVVDSRQLQAMTLLGVTVPAAPVR